MNNLRRSNSGVSVIIGALMLTIIVVTAAASLAVFAADKQERLQSAELAELKRELENIEIIDIVKNSIVFNESSGNLRNITFAIANRHEGESKISAITLNGNVLNDFVIKRQNGSLEHWTINGTSGKYAKNGTRNQTIRIFSNEQVKLHITNLSNSSYYSNDIDCNDAISLKIGTYLTNSFSQIFIPPTAVIKVGIEDDGTVTLDGSLSNHPGETGCIINYKWNVTCIQFSFKPYTFRDLDGGWTFDGDKLSVVNDSVNTSGSTPLAGQPGGLYALNDSNIPFTFIDADGDWEYDIDEEILNTSKNVSGVPAIPEPGNHGGLFASDTTGKPYTFKDYDHDWKFDIEYIANLDPDNDLSNANPQHEDKGGIYANDSKDEPYIFQDVNGNWLYDIGESVINYDPNDNSNNADPSEGEPGGLYANDSSGRNYTFTDYDGDWQYDNETIVMDGVVESGEPGGLYANDTSGEPYTFIDENGNWRYDTEKIIINQSGFQVSEQYIGCLWAYDNQSEPYIFFDNGNWEYDSGESLINDDPDNNTKNATPRNGQKGHLYGNSSNNESFTFIDSNHNWQYDSDEIVNINPKNNGIAIPIFGDKGGLYAVNGTGVYNFAFIDGNGNKIYDGETILSLDPDGKNGLANPVRGDPAGLYVNDSVSGREYSFKDVNGNWSYDDGEIVVRDYSLSGNDTNDMGGLFVFVNSSNQYTFIDENENWQYDDELLCNFSAPVNPSTGDQGGLYAFDTSNEPYTFIDADGDWQYDNETLELNPLGTTGDADPEPGQQGGLYAAVDVKTTYYTDYGMKKTFTFPAETWRKILTLITLTVTDNFGMIGTGSYSYWNK